MTPTPIRLIAPVALATVLGVSKVAVLVIAVVVAIACFPFLRRAFIRRSGGLGFRA